MEAKSLKLSVAADADFSSGLNDAGIAFRRERIGIFIGAEPRSARGLALNEVVRNESAHFGILVNAGCLIEEIFRGGTAVSANNVRRRIKTAGLRDQFRDVLIDRVDRKLVLVAEAIDEVRHIERQVARAFGRRHHLQTPAGFDYQFALTPSAGHVSLKHVRAVILLVARHSVDRLFESLNIADVENPRPRGVSPGTANLARVHKVLIRERVVGAGLRVTSGSDAV